MNHILNRINLTSILIISCLISCEDFVQVDPPRNQIISSQVYTDDATAESAIRGLYSQMISSSGFLSGGNFSIVLLTGRSADEFQNFSTTADYIEFSTNNLSASNAIVRGSLWQEAFKYIYNSNLIIENLEASSSITEAARNQLKGEAKFIRALCNFYLTTLFGDIPVVLSTDYRITSTLARTPQPEVYNQVIEDLLDAQALLNVNYPTAERVRPNKWVATALLARVYLYINDWENAVAQSSSLIDYSSMYRLENNLNGVFLKGSVEAIWQLRPVLGSINTQEGQVFILISPSTNNVALNPDLLGVFESGDNRRSTWIGQTTNGANTLYFPYKYKIKTGGSPLDEYTMILRLAEQYLIRAEANARMNNLPAAINDIDIIRQRAGVTRIVDTNPQISQADLLLVIERERRIELFSECGHRWMDLVRTGRADHVLSQIKTDWKTTDSLYPIPQIERDKNINLSQNKGY